MTKYQNHGEVVRSEYCACPLPWQTRTGPLKDGSHYSDCVAEEVAEDVAALVVERDALRSVLRYWYKHSVKRIDHPDMRDWEDEDWADSGWTGAEAAAIRAALQESTPDSRTLAV